MLNEVIIPAASTLVGGAGVAMVARLMIQSWFKRHDEMSASLHAMAVEMRGLQVSVDSFRKADETLRIQDRAIGVISSRLDRIEKDIHGIEAAITKANPH